MDKTFTDLLGIKYTAGEEAFYDNARDVVVGLMPKETPLTIQLMVSMIVVEMAEFVERNYTYNSGAAQ